MQERNSDPTCTLPQAIVLWSTISWKKILKNSDSEKRFCQMQINKVGRYLIGHLVHGWVPAIATAGSLKGALWVCMVAVHCACMHTQEQAFSAMGPALWKITLSAVRLALTVLTFGKLGFFSKFRVPIEMGNPKMVTLYVGCWFVLLKLYFIILFYLCMYIF